ncbi:hypothetical protein [Azospirillum sp. TSO35-2]|nr:hypothetical protein [Azospirillum sp. TSO35-2]
MLCISVTVASVGVLLLSGVGLAVTTPPKVEKDKSVNTNKRRVLTENIMG